MIVCLLLIQLSNISVLLGASLCVLWFQLTISRLKVAAEKLNPRIFQVGFLIRLLIFVLVMIVSIKLSIFRDTAISFLTFYLVALYKLIERR